MYSFFPVCTFLFNKYLSELRARQFCRNEECVVNMIKSLHSGCLHSSGELHNILIVISAMKKSQIKDLESMWASC